MNETFETYQLIDAGEERKLEQIGPFRVTRQATQAFWPKSLAEATWRDVAAVHHRSSSGGGHWSFQKALPEQWWVNHGPLRFKIKLTGFGHIGLFPEQSENWRWIRERSQDPIQVLNLFGYTGGSTLASALGEARVTHVDASKGVVSWARENAAANNLDQKPIRWIVDDVVRFIEREQRRESVYQGLILDPPTFGRGPRGQVWKIEQDLTPLLSQLSKIMPDPRFILLSCHTPGYSPVCLANILHGVFSLPLSGIESGEMTVPQHDSPRLLPSGAFARWAAPV